MDFSRLEKSIMDVIKEEQAKLGYRKEKIRLYYPLSSLNHFFGTAHLCAAVLCAGKAELVSGVYKAETGTGGSDQ